MAYDCLRRDRLAIAHHLLFLLLAGVLAFEIGVVRSKMDREDIVRVARVDVWYGVFAGAIILVGFSRAIFAAKGWAYYSVNLFFWAKLGAFAVVGLLSIMPTVEFIRWRKASLGNLAFPPPPHGIRNARRVLFDQRVRRQAERRPVDRAACASVCPLAKRFIKPLLVTPSQSARR